MADTGTYVLFLEAKKDLELDIGSLGRFRFAKGLYAYVGSAMGKSVNLETRIGRHKELASKKKGNLQWHIDYFTTAPGVEFTGNVKVVGKNMECVLADLMDTCGARMVASGMGSSDCACKTHFFSIDQQVTEQFLRAMPDLF